MTTLHQRYVRDIAEKKLVQDDAQENAIIALDALIARLAKKNSFSFLRKKKTEKGLYLFGSVGRGKTMLMDWALKGIRAKGFKAERWHFHAFMLEIHKNLKDQAAHAETLDDRIDGLAEIWSKRLQVLCFDEFHVTDVADAMIMMSLFTKLFEMGVIVVATSNWAPNDLYTGGLQRQRFLPFIDTLKTYMDIISVNGNQDYRQMKGDTMTTWFSPLNADTEEMFDIAFRDAVGYDPLETHEIHVQGRTWVIPNASKKVALLDLGTLLNEPLGAADFLALAERYSIIFLNNLEPFSANTNDKTKRFMVMIDAFYDKGVKLVVRADTRANALYPDNGKLNFEFSRTLSRLTEMTRVLETADA